MTLAILLLTFYLAGIILIAAIDQELDAELLEVA